MRQIGTLPDARDARAIADYLVGQSIEARLVESPGGWELWVCDEDKVARAREEYQAFVGALAVVLASGLHPAAAVTAACAAGAAAATRRGAQAALPRPADVLAATGFSWPG